jgi:hypothetical protein
MYATPSVLNRIASVEAATPLCVGTGLTAGLSCALAEPERDKSPATTQADKAPTITNETARKGSLGIKRIFPGLRTQRFPARSGENRCSDSLGSLPHRQLFSGNFRFVSGLRLDPQRAAKYAHGTGLHDSRLFHHCGNRDVHSRAHDLTG